MIFPPVNEPLYLWNVPNRWFLSIQNFYPSILNIWEGSYLNDATYEYIIALVVDPVLQHHFVNHRDEDLVLKKQGGDGE